MTQLILLVSALLALAVVLKKKQAMRGLCPEKENKAKELSSAGDKTSAADIYISILKEEYEREVPRLNVITRYTDLVLPLLRVTGRVEDEMYILRTSMGKCVMHTYGRSWNKWQKRLAHLDSLHPEK